MGTVLELAQISKSFGSCQALKSLSLYLETGHFYGLLGVNGAGKSSLMQIMMRNQLPTTGSGKIFDMPMHEDNPIINDLIGYASESFNFVLSLSLRSIFAQYSRFHSRWDQGLFKNLIEKLHLDLNRYPGELSRGQKMQIALVAAVASRPKLYLLDEVTAVLDAHVRNFFIDILSNEVKNGATVVMATNIITEIHSFADHVLLLHEGELKVDRDMKSMNQFFLKIRKRIGLTHVVFEKEECLEVTINSDRSVSYLVPAHLVEKSQIPDSLYDRREITPEEVFLYYTRQRWNQ